MGRSTREEWAARVARWKDSGLTAAEYASEVGISARSLAWWKWRLGSKTRADAAGRVLARRAPEARATTAAATPPISPLTFVEMTATLEADRLEVVLPSSLRVRVRPGFDGATLGRLLDVLEARR